MRIKAGLSFFLLTILLVLNACDLRGKHSAQGYVETENLYLTSPYSGTLKSLPVERGAQVNKGDLIFQLSPEPEHLQMIELEKVLEQEIALLYDIKAPKRKPEIEAAKAQIEQVNARLNLAKLRMKRFRELYIRKAGNLDEADAALQAFNELQSLKKQREYELEVSMLGGRKAKILAQAAKVQSILARKSLLQWEIEQKSSYASDRAMVVDTYFVEGEWVPAGKPIVSLLFQKHVWIEFFVPAAVLPKIHEGQKVKLNCTGCKPGEGTIAYISPEAEYTPPLVYSRSSNDKLVFRVRAKPAKPELFKSGQPVTVSGF